MRRGYFEVVKAYMCIYGSGASGIYKEQAFLLGIDVRDIAE